MRVIQRTASAYTLPINANRLGIRREGGTGGTVLETSDPNQMLAWLDAVRDALVAVVDEVPPGSFDRMNLTLDVEIGKLTALWGEERE